MSLVSMIPRVFKAAQKGANYAYRGLKASPYVIFGDSAHTFVKAVKDAPVKDALKVGGRAVEAEIKAAKAVHGNFLKHAWTSIKEAPKVIGSSTKAGYTAAKAAGKSGILGGVKGFFKGIGKKMPLIGNALLVAFELPNIIKATKEQGIAAGVKETVKAGARLGGAAIGAAIGASVAGPIGGIAGWIAGEWLTGKIVGKTYSEKKAEEEAKAQEELAALEQLQQQQNQPISFQGDNPYGINYPYMDNPLSTYPYYADDLMMQQLNFNTIA